MPQAGIPQDEEEESIRRNEDSDVQQFYWLHADVEVSCSGDYYQREYYDEEQDASHITYEHSSDYQRSEDDEYEENLSHEEEFEGNSFRNQEEEIKGLTQTDIELIPKMDWGNYHENLNADEKCSICLSHYSEKESLRVLTCLHRFHEICVDKWLLGNRTCPVCRTCAKVET